MATASHPERQINAPIHNVWCSCHLCHEWRERQAKQASAGQNPETAPSTTLSERRRALEKEFLALDDASSPRAFEIAGELGTISEEESHLATHNQCA